MAVREIKSADNAQIKKLAKLKTKKYRDEFKEFMAEGVLSFEAGLTSCYELCCAVMSESFAKENPLYLSKAEDVIITTDKIFEQISDAVTPQGIMGIFKIPENKLNIDKLGKTLVFCDNLRDPGNAGTIIRTADAFGIDGVIFSSQSADVYAPKLVRSTMGSIFHTKTYRECDINDLLNLKNAGYSIICTALSKKTVSLYDWKCPEKCVIVVGNEAHGVSDEILKIADECVKIPMYGFAESLNASVAAAIVMNEAARGKHYGK